MYNVEAVGAAGRGMELGENKGQEDGPSGAQLGIRDSESSLFGWGCRWCIVAVVMSEGDGWNEDWERILIEMELVNMLKCLMMSLFCGKFK